MRARIAWLCLLAASPGCWMPAAAWADSATSLGDSQIHELSGEAIYTHVCQGCHMPGGAGAVGAGHYPKLAGDKRLAAARYPVSLLLHGNGAMPWFNGLLTDVQIADVINYVRSHFGNAYTDSVTPADVAALRGPAPVMER
jgi:mono/diheme cytochrome c family protein